MLSSWVFLLLAFAHLYAPSQGKEEVQIVDFRPFSSLTQAFDTLIFPVITALVITYVFNILYLPFC